MDTLGPYKVPSSNSVAFEQQWKNAAVPISTDISLKMFPKNNESTRGLSAKRAYKKNDAIVQISPSDCLIVSDTGKRGMIVGLEDLWPTLSGNSRLSLQLLKLWTMHSMEGSTGNRFIDSYIESLPGVSEFSSPFHWNDSTLEKFPYKSICRFKFIRGMSFRIIDDAIIVIFCVIFRAMKIQRKKWRELYDRIQSIEIFSSVPVEVNIYRSLSTI